MTLAEEGHQASLVEQSTINIVPQVFEYLFGVRLHMAYDEKRHRGNGNK